MTIPIPYTSPPFRFLYVLEGLGCITSGAEYRHSRMYASTFMGTSTETSSMAKIELRSTVSNRAVPLSSINMRPYRWH